MWVWVWVRLQRRHRPGEPGVIVVNSPVAGGVVFDDNAPVRRLAPTPPHFNVAALPGAHDGGTVSVLTTAWSAQRHFRVVDLSRPRQRGVRVSPSRRMSRRETAGAVDAFLITTGNGASMW